MLDLSVVSSVSTRARTKRSWRFSSEEPINQFSGEAEDAEANFKTLQMIFSLPCRPHLTKGFLSIVFALIVTFLWEVASDFAHLKTLIWAVMLKCFSEAL